MARRQVSIFINGREVANQIKDITAEKRKVTRELNLMTVGSKEYNDKVKELARLNGVIDNHRQNLRGVESTWSKVSAGVGKFAAVAGIAFGAEMIVEYGKKLFSLGSEMELLTRKAETVFADALPQVTEAARANANAMGLTVSQYTDASTAIGDLLIPMKFTREEAANISTGLVDLSGALAEWTGGQRTAEEVTKILGKAMLGEREELKSLGISINEADVKARLAQKGLEGLTGEMLQQAKAAATLELITEKSADAQTAFANNADTSARKQAEITARLTDVTEKLATALIPVFSRLLEAVVPVVDIIGDVVTVLTEGAEPAKKYGRAVDGLANTFEYLFGWVKIVWNILASVANFWTGDWVKSIVRGKLALAEFGNQFIRFANGVNILLGLDKIELFDTSDLEGQLDKFDEKNKEVVAKVKESRNDLDADAALRKAAEIEKSKAAAAKKYEAVQKEIEKGETKIAEIIKAYQEEKRLSALSEDDRKLEEIRLQYQKEIDLAAELAAKGSTEALEQKRALETLQAQAIDELKSQLAQESFDVEMLQLDELEQLRIQEEIRRDAEKKAAAESVKDFVSEAELSDREKALEALNEYYLQVGGLATANGIDVEQIHEAHRVRLAAINEKFDKEDATKAFEAQQEKSKLLRDSFSALASAVSSSLSVIGSESEEFVQLQKVLTLVQIGIDTAAAISALTRFSSANPANAVTGGLAGAIQFSTGLVQILANIAKAKQVLSQKKEGGYHNVTGKDDGVSYRAKYIGAPNSGMLPDSPVVLASERGREYFVSNHDLQNPVVANYVRMIDNISNNRIPQYAEGGFSSGDSASVSRPQGDSLPVSAAVLVALDRLNQVLNRGIYAKIDDDTVVDIIEKFRELNAASGNDL